MGRSRTHGLAIGRAMNTAEFTTTTATRRVREKTQKNKHKQHQKDETQHHMRCEWQPSTMTQLNTLADAP